MEDFYERLKQFKKNNKLTFSDLGRIISVSADAFRMALNKRNFSELRKERIIEVMEGKTSMDTFSSNDLFLEKDGVKISVDEVITFTLKNIKWLYKNGKIDVLKTAINTIDNTDAYNNLNREIKEIKALLERNKDVLK